MRIFICVLCSPWCMGIYVNVLIVGANRGLGLSLCHVYAANDCKVYAGTLANQPHDELKELARKYPALDILDMDVTDTAKVERAAGHISAGCGMLDVVVYCSGILCDSDRVLPITRADLEDLWLALDINVMGAARVIRAFHTLVRENGWFMVITSEGGSLQNIGTTYPAYSVTKAAENKLVGTFAKTVSGYSVYAVHPGRMNTPMGREFAQIEPSESAEGIFSITSGAVKVAPENGWFINYKGEAMEV